jgi:hypothetical protein
MGCVLVEARHLGPLRRSIEGLASGVAPRVHFNNDSDRQKRRVLDAIAEMPIEAFAVMCTKSHSTNEFQARAACVAEIVRQVQRREVANLVLESRQDDRDDERVISRTRTREPMLVFEHRTARHECMLWIADAVTWAVGAGSPWRDRLGDSLTDVIELEP